MVGGKRSASASRRAGSLLRSVWRSEGGVAAIEFAIVAVPFFGLLLLIAQVGLYHFSLQSLDFATRLAGRQIMTGQVPLTTTTATIFKQNLICPNVFWGISCDKLVVNAYRVGKTSKSTDNSGVYAYMNATSKAMNPPVTDPSKQSFCLGGPGDYIYVDVAYPYPNFVARLLQAAAGATMPMRSSTFVFNEPYRTASAAGSC